MRPAAFKAASDQRCSMGLICDDRGWQTGKTPTPRLLRKQHQQAAWADRLMPGFLAVHGVAPTACHQGPPAGTVYIFCCRALASCRRRPLS